MILVGPLLEFLLLAELMSGRPSSWFETLIEDFLLAALLL